MSNQASIAARRPIPVLFILGILSLVVLQVAHFASVLGLTPGTPVDHAAEIIRANITPFAWCAYLMLLLGFLALRDGRSWLWRHFNRFAVCWLWSIPAWCYFDWMNFYFMRDPATGKRAWEYVNLPPLFQSRLAGYLVAFGAIAPGMFLTAEVLQRLGFRKISTRPRPAELKINNQKSKIFPLAIFFLGVLLAPIPILLGTPASNLAIWVGTWALLDPINLRLGRPSIVGDWMAGRFGRTLALGAGGLICGFLWEFWNFWAYSKWIYHLPFLGSWERYKYFEMPVPGLIGFIAFGIETWTMWQTALLVLAPFVEGERDAVGDVYIQQYSCI